MEKTVKEYVQIKVESFIPSSTSGRHGEVHIRPFEGQYPYTPDMSVRCSKELSNDYPVGTRFLIKINAEISRREGGTPFISSFHSWKYEVLK